MTVGDSGDGGVVTVMVTMPPSPLSPPLSPKLVIGAIKMNNGVVKYDPQTLAEMQGQLSGRQRKSAESIRAKLEEARKKFGK